MKKILAYLPLNCHGLTRSDPSKVNIIWLCLASLTILLLPLEGTPDDPKYQSVPALVYQRHKRLLEPINLPLVFTNSVLEDNLPEQVQSLVDQVQLEPEFVDLARKRVNWCLTNDSAMRKLPKNKEFPYLDQNPPRCYGITSNRKESNMLQAFFDLANLWIGRHVTNSKLIIQRFSYPNCVHQFDRDQRKVVLDLECDFVSLVTSPDKVSRLCLKEFDANYQTNTRDRSLVSIRPLSWAVGLDTKNFYNTSIEFKTPPNSALQSIFLSNNNVRNLNNEDFQGRSIMFSYGYALKQAQLISGVGAGQPLDRSIPLQCIFTNPKDNSLGFVLFQLNTTKWNDDDQDVRNQVWLGQTATVADDNGLEVILKQLIALQMRSLV